MEVLLPSGSKDLDLQYDECHGDSTQQVDLSPDVLGSQRDESHVCGSTASGIAAINAGVGSASGGFTVIGAAVDAASSGSAAVGATLGESADERAAVGAALDDCAGEGTSITAQTVDTFVS